MRGTHECAFIVYGLCGPPPADEAVTGSSVWAESIGQIAFDNKDPTASELALSQYALRPLASSEQVRRMMRRSSQMLQLLMYQRSCSTRFFMRSISAVPPRNPLTCAQPEIPGLT